LLYIQARVCFGSKENHVILKILLTVMWNSCQHARLVANGKLIDIPSINFLIGLVSSWWMQWVCNLSGRGW
jgi:hypothetical protein